MLHRYYTLSAYSRIVEREESIWLECDYPFQRHQLNESGAKLLKGLAGEVSLEALVGDMQPSVLPFLQRLEASGALHCRYVTTPPTSNPRVDVVIPVLNNATGLIRCLKALAGQRYPLDRIQVTVVDDGSEIPIQQQVESVQPKHLNVRWLRMKTNHGPASARNFGAGLSDLTTQSLLEDAPFTPGKRVSPDLICFTDSDCEPDTNWISQLVAVFENAEIAGVGGQVLGCKQESLLARYESACSSLNMGPKASPAGNPSGRVPYLPACNFAIRRSALRKVGGFTEGMRLGEDVDLNWRLYEAGEDLMYFPEAKICHHHRSSWWAFLKRKAQYATTEPRLNRWRNSRLPQARQKHDLFALIAIIAVIFSGVLDQAWMLAFLFILPLIGISKLVLFSERGIRNKFLGHRWKAGIRLGVAGLFQEARQFIRHTFFLWFPIIFFYPFASSGNLMIVIIAILAEKISKQPKLPWNVYVIGFLAENLAYSAGYNWGLVKRN